MSVWEEKIKFSAGGGPFKYRKRSCRNCDRFTEERCRFFRGVRDFKSEWLDAGRMGCHWYEGMYFNEPKRKTQGGAPGKP